MRLPSWMVVAVLRTGGMELRLALPLITKRGLSPFSTSADRRVPSMYWDIRSWS